MTCACGNHDAKPRPAYVLSLASLMQAEWQTGGGKSDGFDYDAFHSRCRSKSPEDLTLTEWNLAAEIVWPLVSDGGGA